MVLNNLQVRILAGAIYFPILFLMAYDTQAFSFIMTICLGIAWHEYLKFCGVVNLPEEKLQHGLKIFMGILPPLLLGLGYSMAFAIAVLAIYLQLCAIKSLTRKGTLNGLKEDLGFDVLGLLYITGLFSMLTYIQIDAGPVPIWFIFLVVGASDTGAYFAGKYRGKSPFFQNISPKKTMEGFMGGVIAAMIVAIIFKPIFSYYNFSTPGYFFCAILGGAVSVISAFGDLFESMLKRNYNVKDSGNLIPGHGGILDRLDAVLFAAVPVFFFVILRGGFR